MQRIEKFESFVLSQSLTLDQTTVDFIEGKITETNFIKYLNSEVLNEGIIDNLKSFYVKFKEKAFDVLMTFLKKASKIGFDIFDKMKTFVNWIVDSLSKWKKENPEVWAERHRVWVNYTPKERHDYFEAATPEVQDQIVKRCHRRT